MNIIIPIGGVGSRFVSDHDFPKPLIRVVNDSPMVVMVIESLHINKDDTLYIAYQKECDKYHFQRIILEHFPDINIRFVVLDGITMGAPDTLRKVLLTMPHDDLELPLVSFDVDTIYRENVIDILKIKAHDQNAILHFYTTEPEPIYSYVLLVRDRVVQIEEKVQISYHACSGAYKFESGQVLLKYINSLYDAEKTSKEKHTSAVYRQLLEDDVPVYGYQISGIDCVGTPAQLLEYQRRNT